MSLVESLPMYGVHYYSVKDKRNIPWWLGISSRGIAQYDYADRKSPRKTFYWRQLENLYFRDRKFSVEVHETQRITSSTWHHLNAGNISVYVWFGKTQALAKCVWQMAISQHQFYLDQKQAKGKPAKERKLNEIARELTKSCASLSTASSSSNPSHCGSTNSLNLGSVHSIADSDNCEAVKAAKMEMNAALKARRDALKVKLQQKHEELKILCIKEAEITGVLPPEIPLAPGESPPPFRRRVGTAFTLPENLLDKLWSKEEESLSNLQLEFEIQSRITSAALRLASDDSAKKSLRRQRKINYQQSQKKLADIKNKLTYMQQSVGTSLKTQKQRKKPRPPPDTDVQSGDFSHDHTDSDSIPHEASISLSPTPQPQVPSSKFDTHSQHSGSSIDRAQVCTLPLSAPSTPTKHTEREAQTPSPRLHRFPSGSYVPSATYIQPTYENQHYQVVSSDQPQQWGGTWHRPHATIGTRGLYNVPQQRTSQAFCSLDQLDGDTSSSNIRTNRFGSLDRRKQTGSGRLESRSLDNLDTLPVVIANEEEIPVQPSYSYHTPEEVQGYLQGDKSAGESEYTWNDFHGYLCNSSNLNYKFSHLALPQEIEDALLPGQTYPEHSLGHHAKVLEQRNSQMHGSESDIVSLPSAPYYHQQPCNRKIKEKEWYETSLDSPLPILRPRVKSRCSSGSSQTEVVVPVHSVPCYANQNAQCSDSTSQHLSVSSHSLYQSEVMANPNKLFPNTYPLTECTDIHQAQSETGGDVFDTVVPFESPKNHMVIQAGKYQPYREVTKPFEMSDFYKYSTKFRKQSQSSDQSSTSIHQKQSAISPRISTKFIPMQSSHPSGETRVHSPVLSPSRSNTVSPQHKGVYLPLQPMACRPVDPSQPAVEICSPSRPHNCREFGSRSEDF